MIKIRNAVLGALMLLFSGCIPIPHTSVRFPQMDGRVIDANTGKPIGGATIAIHDNPKVFTKSDDAGRFRLERQKNFHLAYDVNFVCGPGDIGGKYWSYNVDVSALGYVAARISAPSHHISYDKIEGSYLLKDISLSSDPTVQRK